MAIRSDFALGAYVLDIAAARRVVAIDCCCARRMVGASAKNVLSLGKYLVLSAERQCPLGTAIDAKAATGQNC